MNKPMLWDCYAQGGKLFFVRIDKKHPDALVCANCGDHITPYAFSKIAKQQAQEVKPIVKRVLCPACFQNEVKE